MTTMPNHINPLTAALAVREGAYAEVVDRLRDDGTQAREDGALLREAVEMVRCLRRLVEFRTADEIHKAFGAPGDFGYDTPIGAALAKIYKGA